MATLLVVDDDPSMREVLRDFVELCCPELSVVGEAANGAEAVDLASRLVPDVILMDVRMPILDGIQATRRLKQELGLASAIVTFTSYTMPELEREARVAGAAFHLRKPFSLEELRAVLLQAAERSAPPGEGEGPQGWARARAVEAATEGPWPR